MEKTKKITISFLLILLLLTPVLFFIIYPNYNKLLLALNSFKIYDITKETSVKILTQISPPKDTYKEQVLGYTSIEESLSNTNIVLDRKILEDFNTTILVENLNIQGEIVQGENSQRMNDGFWHFPTSALPGERGNAVIIGHRFMHLPPRKDTFFNLEDIKIGEKINIISNSGNLTYIVVETKVVEPNDISVITDSDDYKLTLITCTPLWTSEKRFVVTAKLDKLYKKV